MAALAFTAYGVHWFALGLGRAFAGDPRPNGFTAIPFLVLSVLAAVVFFGADDNPVGGLFCGLAVVYICEFFASVGYGRSKPREKFSTAVMQFVAVGLWPRGSGSLLGPGIGRRKQPG
jgi:hypothetical protein